MGVTYEKARNKYRATTQVNGKTKHIGRFDTKLKATRALNKFRKENAVTPLIGKNFKNVGINGKGEIVPHRNDQDEEARFEAEFNKLREDELANEPASLASFYGFDINDPIVEPEPTLWDKIKSIWRNTRQRN